MSKELQSTDITTIASVPELLQLVEEVQRSQQPHLLKRQDEQVALIVPVTVTPAKAAPKRKRRTGLLTKDDPLFQMIGTGHSGIPGGVSGKKHEYLARAYRTHVSAVPGFDKIAVLAFPSRTCVLASHPS